MGSEIEFGMRRGMVETSIHAAGNIERYILISAAVVHTLSILVLQKEGLSAEIHLLETLACTHETFIGLTGKRE